MGNFNEASLLDKCGALCEDITALAQLPSSSKQNEEYEHLKTEVASNSKASSMQLAHYRLDRFFTKDVFCFHFLFKKKLEYWFD